MREIQRNNYKAFEELHLRYSKRLLHFMIKMLNNDTEKARDFLQEIFLKLVEKPYLFDTQKKFYSWIFTVAANMCRTAHRDSKAVHLSVDLNHLQRTSTEPVLVTRHDAGVFNEHLGRALDNLEYEQKETFLLRFQEDMSLNDIAEVMNCSVGTVKSRIYYTTRKLAGELQEFKPLLDKL